MKAGYVSLLLAVVVTAVATIELRSPFSPFIHIWWVALAMSLAGSALLVGGALAAFGARGDRGAGLAAFGGSLLSACVVYAAIVVGAPARVPAAPGQSYKPPRASDVEVDFPSIPAEGAWPDRVTIVDGQTRTDAVAGDVERAGAFVFAVTAGPAAVVDARSPSGAPVTMTQPDNPAFLSDVLLFPGTDIGQPEDYFSIPALHRDVQVDYYAGLPAHHIDIPFVALRISEENGGSMYEGVAVSGRPLRAAGAQLSFELGAYPVVTMSGAPPIVPYWAGIAMVAAGCMLFAAGAVRRREKAE